ncbi:MAG: hypothetical protein JNJ49_09350, partial [Bdellovibrionaceae bacterium]|nr:hypothetical protein [Pseudobdellovibrionaceae bacterium]
MKFYPVLKVVTVTLFMTTAVSGAPSKGAAAKGTSPKEASTDGASNLGGPQPVLFAIGDNKTDAVISPSVLLKLRAMRAAYDSGQTDACLSEAPRAKKVAKSLEPWIVGLELRCAMKVAGPKKANADRLVQVLDAVDAKPVWLATGVWASRLKETYLQGRLLALEWDSKFNRTRAWQHVERATAIGVSSLDEAGRAKL